MIKTLRFIFNFYVEASIHVALSVYALFFLFVMAHNLPYDESIAYTLFYGTITGYNFVKFAPIAKLHHRSLTKSLRLIQLFSMLCFFALVYYATQLPLRTIVVFFVGMMIVLAYVFPLFNQINLRSVGKLKIYIVAFCWTLALVIAPAIHYNLIFSSGLGLEVLQIYILIIALIIPFDIRDLKYDTISLETIPQKIGVEKAKILSYMLLCLYVGIDFYLKEKEHYLAALIIILIAIFFIQKMPVNPVKYYCSFGVEGLPILKLLIVIVIICF